VVEREPRLVHVYRYSIDRIALPEIDFSVLCSKGFYVRTYVHDIGEALGCGAHLKSLRRIKSGRFDVASAITVDEIKNAPREEILSRMLSLPEVSRVRGA
jgi:tRNA pseudouridine55 synthase